MKSYFLNQIPDKAEAERVLCELLPGQTEPWLICAPDGDPIAYLNIQDSEDYSGDVVKSIPGMFDIQADISGRHFNQDKLVLGILSQLQEKLGGLIEDDFENVIWFQRAD